MLIYVSDRPQKQAVCSVLFAHGVLFYICPYETALFFCEKKDVGGVVIDCVPNLRQGEVLCATLRRLYPDMPIAAILPAIGQPDLESDFLIRDDSRSDEIAAQIEHFLQSRCAWDRKRLSTYALTVDLDALEVRYLGYPLPLSKTEFRILYCLF